ncbi:hypothetical protein ABKV41_16465 (plasmid) [Enterobacter roggenkampii]|uniref:hypothetical protein n=1 Tax=Enterobacter roggenkampii TaxID=1812935 RepID=UPI0032AF5EE6
MNINTRDNIAIGTTFGGVVAFGNARQLDVKTLLGVYGSAVKADGMVSIDAETLRKMTEELILSKYSASTTVGAGQSYVAFHGVRSDDREMKPMPGHAYAITTRPYAF